MSFLVALVIFACLIAIWLIPASRGASRRADALETAIAQLLECDIPGAFLTVRPKFSPYKFIQYARYEQDSGEPGIEMAFPRARWSEEYFPRVVSVASEWELRYEVQDRDESELQFVFVRFDKSIPRAAMFGQTVLNDIFGFDKDYLFRVRIN